MADIVTAAVTACQGKTVTTSVTNDFWLCGSVPSMVTSKKRQPLRPKAPVRRAFYLKEWRKYMGTKPIELAIALDIERQSYHRLETNWWTISAGEMDIIATTIGIKPSQLWFPPPKDGESGRKSLDDLLEDIPENMRPAAFLALRGMAGK
jgi:DNA-binding XRE family transcriptional regulator